MNTESSESFLSKSSMDYPLKATWYLRGVESTSTSCPDCPNPPMFMSEKTKECCKRCNFLMMIWLLNEEQLEIWREVRPPEKQKEEIEKAIKEHKMPQIEVSIGGVPELSTLPLFLK